jgi:hypothetical protein
MTDFARDHLSPIDYERITASITESLHKAGFGICQAADGSRILPFRGIGQK